MLLVNTEGLAIFGPGSEWLWTMGQFLALAVTGYAIFRQIRAQRSANRVTVMAALVDKWESERMVRHRLAAMMHVVEAQPGWPPALFDIGMFFERIALLVNHGDVSLRNAWEEWSYPVQAWWLGTAAQIDEERTKSGPALWAGWEMLVQAMAELDRRDGRPPIVLDATGLRAWSLSISDLIERLRLEQEARSGLVPTWQPADAAVPA